MSYDLMVFQSDKAPTKKEEFLNWYSHQTEWSEEHSYDDPQVTSENLRNWFLEMIESFPALNGPYASEDIDSDRITDYCIGKDVIYAGFRWSKSDEAYDTMIELAAKHEVGFYDASGTGDILTPNGKGDLRPINMKQAWCKFW